MSVNNPCSLFKTPPTYPNYVGYYVSCGKKFTYFAKEKPSKTSYAIIILNQQKKVPTRHLHFK